MIAFLIFSELDFGPPVIRVDETHTLCAQLTHVHDVMIAFSTKQTFAFASRVYVFGCKTEPQLCVVNLLLVLGRHVTARLRFATWANALHMSAFDPNRTSRYELKHLLQISARALNLF